METMKSAANAYQSVQFDAAVLGASPHELIAKLMARAIEATEDAKTHMLQGDVAAKGQEIKVATTIITDGLRSCLNMEEGGEIAANLDALYDYMLQNLVKAHAENTPELLDEVASLMREIKSGWDGIKP